MSDLTRVLIGQWGRRHLEPGVSGCGSSQEVLPVPPPSPSHLPSPLPPYPPSLRPWCLVWPPTLPSLPGKGRLHILYLYLPAFCFSLL